MPHNKIDNMAGSSNSLVCMKRTLFLNHILSLIGALLVTVSSSVNAAVLHADVARVTYHDFGQNYGRYSVENVNQLLEALNTTTISGINSSGGVHVSYTGGQTTWTMPHGMISYDSLVDSGWGAALGNNYVVTVKHNGENNATFTKRDIGSHAINYSGIGYRRGNVFCVGDSGTDYKLTRMSKLVTDVVPMEHTDKPFQAGEMYYRAGAGGTGVYYQADSVTGAPAERVPLHNYSITGGVMVGRGGGSPTGSFQFDWNNEEISETKPLPFSGMGGDSGSPVFVWDDESGTYKYQGALYAISGIGNTFISMNADWTTQALSRFDVDVDFSKVQVQDGTSTVYLYASDTALETITDEENGVVGRQWQGDVRDAAGNVVAQYKGVHSNFNTWKSLSDLKNNDEWYAYGHNYLNATANNQGSATQLNEADLYNTQNLVFKASGADLNKVVLAENVDLGIGYLEFSAGEQAQAQFELSASGNQTLDSAGFVVGENVDLTITYINADASNMREWRKIGAGDLHLKGDGNNEIFLNIGRGGTTYLENTAGYAAYNVLVNTGSTLVIKDRNQIANNLTFGAGGGTLDMNGNSMEWNNTRAVEAEGFGISAITQDAVITNRRGNSVLSFTQGDSQTFLGSFTDTADSSLKVEYSGGGEWTLHSIHTNLQHADSGLDVQNGKVILAGTATKHAPGSLYSVSDDWHYADAAMNVTVKVGATFELGSHARLDGNVTVESGGTYVMREGVQQQMEYIEGWYAKEDTYAIREFYGHKGDVSLAEGATMKVEYSTGTSAENVYAGNISGKGNVTVDLGTSGASLLLSGTNTFSGEKTIQSGTLNAASFAALGSVVSDDTRWKIESLGVLSSADFTADNADKILDYVHSESSGVLALQGSEHFEQLDLSGHESLYIGAMEGHDVQYGEQGTTESLQSYNGAWNLGGGGGSLTVNYALSDGSTLNLGNAYTEGSVVLTNEKNNIGTIKFNGAVTLAFSSHAALGGGQLDMGYGVRVFSSSSASSILAESVQQDAAGVLLLDKLENKAENIDLSNHTTLALGAYEDTVYEGSINVANDATYYLGGSSGKLTLTQGLAAKGTNALVVDGQGYSGGTIELGAASGITGAVTVRGYDAEQTDKTGGDVVLSFTANQALASAESVAVSNNGAIDINGTSQTFNNLSLAEGTSVYDSKRGGDNELNLVYNRTEYSTSFSIDATLDGAIDVRHLKKSGDGTLALNQAINFDTFTVEAGTVVLNKDNVLSNYGVTRVEEGAIVRVAWVDPTSSTGVATDANFIINGGEVNLCSGAVMATDTFSGTVAFNNGGVLYGNNLAFTGEISFNNGGELNVSSIGSNPPVNNAISSNITVYSGTGIIADSNTQDTLTTLSGNITLYHGTSLVLSAPENKNTKTTYNISSAAINDFIEVDENDPDNVLLAGTLDVQTSVLNLTGTNQSIGGTLKLHNTTVTGSAGVKDIENLRLADGADATLTGNEVDWNIHSLNGAGKQLTIGGSGSVLIDGAGDFSGTLTKNAGNLELAHAQAVQNAHVSVLGSTKLAINADSMTMKSLSGAAGATLLAGSMGDTESGHKATLTITGDANADFAGTVKGSAEQGFSLVKTGAGSQTFSGAAELHDITLESGTLALKNATVHGDISLAQGTTLELTKGYVLDADKTINVSAVQDSTASAVLQGNLTIAGGTLLVDSGALLNATEAALKVDSVDYADGAVLNIQLGSLSNVNAGQAYTIVTGNWENFTTINTLGLQYYDYTYECSADGLKISFKNKEGAVVWDGTNEKNTWDSTSFGQNNTTPTGIAIFNDAAECKDVNLAFAPNVEKIYFDNSAGNDYSISGEGYLSQISEISKAGDGHVTLDVNIANNNANIHLYDGSIELTDTGAMWVKSIKAYDDTTIINNASIVTQALEVQQGATLRVNGGDVIFQGSGLNASGGNLALQNVSLTTFVNNISLKGNLAFEGADNTWNGYDMAATIAAGAQLSLADGAKLSRTDTGATVISGILTSEADASATFSTAGAIQLAENGSIAVGEGSHLTVQTAAEGSAAAGSALQLAANSTLSVDGHLAAETLRLQGRNSKLDLVGDSKLALSAIEYGENASTTLDGVALTIAPDATPGAASRTITAGFSLNLTNGSVVDDRNACYRVSGDFSLRSDDGAEAGTLYVRQLRLAESNRSGSSSFLVGRNTHMIITGDTAGQDGAFSLSHWNRTTALNIEGTLTSNAKISSWDSTNASVNVKSGGELNLLKGLARNTGAGQRSKDIHFNVASGAAVYAAGGEQGSGLNVKLAAGATLGGIADTEGGTAVFTNNMKLGTNGSAQAVVFDTDVRTATDYMLTKGKGGDIVLSGSNTVDGTASVKVTGSGKLYLSDAAKSTGVSIAQNQGADASISNVSVFTCSDGGASISGSASSRARIDHAYIDVLSGGVLNLSYVTVSDTSYITDAAATMNVNDVQLDVSLGKNADSLVSSIPSEGLELRQMGGDITSTIFAPGDATVLAITSGIMDTVTVTGSSLTINLSNVGDLDSYDYLSLQFKNQDKLATTFANTLIVNIVCNEQELSGPAYYAVTSSTDASGALVNTLYIRTSDDAVPEPTTATLSLLALAALAARRRRK